MRHQEPFFRNNSDAYENDSYVKMKLFSLLVCRMCVSGIFMFYNGIHLFHLTYSHPDANCLQATDEVADSVIAIIDKMEIFIFCRQSRASLTFFGCFRGNSLFMINTINWPTENRTELLEFFISFTVSVCVRRLSCSYVFPLNCYIHMLL